MSAFHYFYAIFACSVSTCGLRVWSKTINPNMRLILKQAIPPALTDTFFPRILNFREVSRPSRPVGLFPADFASRAARLDNGCGKAVISLFAVCTQVQTAKGISP